MNSFCNYSDLPSLEWWDKINLIELTNRHIRKDLHDEVELIITLSNKSDLSNLEKLTKEKKYEFSTISSICIELDFLATKLKYFKKLDRDLSFGIEFDLVPELIAKWRDEKIDNIL